VATATTAVAAVRHLIVTQRRRAPGDDEDALFERFRRREVRLDDGTVLQPTDVVPGGKFIWFYRLPAPERAVPGTLRLLYRDEHILVADKPPFMSTLPRGQHITQTAVVRARRQFGIDDLSPVHRLDRLTRGVLLFTVHRGSRAAYQQLFERRMVSKTYEAVTPVPTGWQGTDFSLPGGSLTVPAGALHFASPEQVLDVPGEEHPWELSHLLVKERGRLATYIQPGTPNSLTRVTGVRFSSSGDRLVWTLKPATGKTHQLRVNMRLFAAPIVNDPIYSVVSDDALYNPDAELPYIPSVDEEDFDRPMGLTARELAFTDPYTGESRRFISSYGN